MDSTQDKLIARLFKDTLIIFLLSMFVSTIGYVIDGIITGEFLGEDSMAAFGLTMPYQKFVTMSECKFFAVNFWAEQTCARRTKFFRWQ